MKLDVKEKDQIKRDISIEVDPESLRGLKEKVLDKINKEVNIPGFRKGKAPIDLIEKRFADLVKQELLKEAIPFYYNKALEQEKIEVVGFPKIKDAEYRQGSLSFIAQVEIKPQIPIDSKTYSLIKINQSLIEVEDKEVEKFLDQFKEKISGVFGKKKDDIDDKLASSWAGYKDKDEFKKAIHCELYISKIVQRRRETEREITQVLLNKVKFEVPQSLVEEQKKHLLTQQIMDMQARGVSEEEIKKHSDEISRKIDALAKEQVKLYYILEEIAKKEKLIYSRENLYEVVLGFILSNVLAE